MMVHPNLMGFFTLTEEPICPPTAFTIIPVQAANSSKAWEAGEGHQVLAFLRAGCKRRPRPRLYHLVLQSFTDQHRHLHLLYIKMFMCGTPKVSPANGQGMSALSLLLDGWVHGWTRMSRSCLATLCRHEIEDEETLGQRDIWLFVRTTGSCLCGLTWLA